MIGKEIMSRPQIGLSLALALVAGVGLAACGSSASQDSGNGTVTIHVEGWKGGGSEPANVAQVNAAFEKAYPNIKVNFEYVPANDTYQQKLQPELLAGKAGDVIMTDSSKVQTWGKAGYLADLSSTGFASSIKDDVKPYATYNNKVLGAPMELIGIGLYANTDLLKKAGVASVPATWPDFLAALGKLKAAGITPISLPDKSGWTANLTMQAAAATLLYQQNSSWDQQFVEGKTTFGKDWPSSLAQLTELSAAGYVDWQKELGIDEWSQGIQAFTAGNSGFWFQGAWNIGAVQKGNFPIAFAPWPAGGAGTKPSALYFSGTMWSANARSSHLDAAQKYIDFWTKSENLSLFLQAENAVSPYTGGSTPSSDVTAAFVEAFTQNRYHLLPSNTWDTGEADTAIGSALQGYLLGKASAEATLTSIQSSVKK
jgi:raffinose/stachyose/melibiose transport system substrate-binding protein